MDLEDYEQMTALKKNDAFNDGMIGGINTTMICSLSYHQQQHQPNLPKLARQ